MSIGDEFHNDPATEASERSQEMNDLQLSLDRTRENFEEMDRIVLEAENNLFPPPLPGAKRFGYPPALPVAGGRGRSHRRKQSFPWIPFIIMVWLFIVFLPSTYLGFISLFEHLKTLLHGFF